MPSKRPHIPAAPAPERLSRTERRERRRQADEAGRNPRPAPEPPRPFESITNPRGLADEHRQIAASLARGREAFELVLREPCHAHRATTGTPCWTYPRGVCGGRVSTALLRVSPKGPPKYGGRPPRPFRTGYAEPVRTVAS